MTLFQPLYMQAGNYSATLDRQVVDALSPQTISTVLPNTRYPEQVAIGAELQVVQRAAGANLSVDVQPGKCIILGSDVVGQGKYVCWSDAVVNVSLNSAPPSGQSRWDLIIGQVRDSTVIGGSNNDWIIDKVTGTPATTGSEVVPTVPHSSIVLAYVHVGPLVASIVSANITDRRVRIINMALPEPVVATTPLTQFFDPSGNVLIAQGNAYSGMWKRPRDTLYCRVYRQAAATSITGNIPYGFDTIDRDPYNMTVVNNATITVPINGYYLCSAQLGFTATALGEWMQMSISQGSGTSYTPITSSNAQASASSGNNFAQCITARFLSAGTNLQVWFQVSVAGLALLTTYPNAYFEVMYLGQGY